jgi:CheY-like chemotaxis protein
VLHSSRSRPLSRAGGIILVVEDDSAVGRIIEIVLSRAGYRIIRAPDGQRAFDAFWGHAQELALLLVDIEVPVIRGPQFVNSIPTLEPRIPVLFIATQAEPDIGHLVAQGFAVLSKPFTPAILTQAMLAVLGKSAANCAPFMSTSN